MLWIFFWFDEPDPQAPGDSLLQGPKSRLVVWYTTCIRIYLTLGGPLTVASENSTRKVEFAGTSVARVFALMA